MAKVTDLDCSSEAFKYLDGKSAEVAGVPSLLLRIGFVGEVGYEIHFPAAHGEHLWDALLDAGAEHGLRPFGLEPQRVLRLWLKRHAGSARSARGSEMCWTGLFPAAQTRLWPTSLDSASAQSKLTGAKA